MSRARQAEPDLEADFLIAGKLMMKGARENGDLLNDTMHLAYGLFEAIGLEAQPELRAKFAQLVDRTMATIAAAEPKTTSAKK